MSIQSTAQFFVSESYYGNTTQDCLCFTLPSPKPSPPEGWWSFRSLNKSESSLWQIQSRDKIGWFMLSLLSDSGLVCPYMLSWNLCWYLDRFASHVFLLWGWRCLLERCVHCNCAVLIHCCMSVELVKVFLCRLRVSQIFVVF